ncbi:cation:proton antiporter subunit C [Methanoplanus sp. FWC-SCC4]|uniref:Cation:proton antiporter subunit C n=1 Tax=Methanochimaera problematica TaxID=2609417 RepID=A0AA97I4H8_9EURY|nr:cation:proton antiporter subunit C [Methanoplanus sp. FWC-SCC4]WOF16366.1 cation:proton antiporter subunit C [Methanoplanus sp. FWC-SCC4]
MIYNLPYIAAVIIIILGIITMVTKKNLIKIIMGLSLVEAGVNLFLVATGYVSGGSAPIFTNAASLKMVFPTVQAMTLTNIVIGIATTAMLLSFVMVIYKKYKSASVTDLGRLKG